MNEKEALDKGGFTYIKGEVEDYEEIKHCGEKSIIECVFPGINTVTCGKCKKELTQKIIIGECFLN